VRHAHSRQEAPALARRSLSASLDAQEVKYGYAANPPSASSGLLFRNWCERCCSPARLGSRENGPHTGRHATPRGHLRRRSSNHSSHATDYGRHTPEGSVEAPEGRQPTLAPHFVLSFRHLLRADLHRLRCRPQGARASWGADVTHDARNVLVRMARLLYELDGLHSRRPAR